MIWCLVYFNSTDYRFKKINFNSKIKLCISFVLWYTCLSSWTNDYIAKVFLLSKLFVTWARPEMLKMCVQIPAAKLLLKPATSSWQHLHVGPGQRRQQWWLQPEQSQPKRKLRPRLQSHRKVAQVTHGTSLPLFSRAASFTGFPRAGNIEHAEVRYSTVKLSQQQQQ